jgi:hypothetical protein
MKAVSHLGQFAFIAVPDDKPARNNNVGHAFVRAPESWCDAELGVSGVGKTLGRWHGLTGVLQQSGVLRMVEAKLALAEVGKPEFVHRRGIDGPSVAEVPLLDALIVLRAEARHIGAGGLEARERLSKSIVIDIVIEIQLLPIRDRMVDAHSALMIAISLARDALKLAVSAIRDGTN